MIAKRGYDTKTVLAEWAEFIKLLDELKMVFDSDPRRVSKVLNQPSKEPPLLFPMEIGRWEGIIIKSTPEWAKVEALKLLPLMPSIKGR